MPIALIFALSLSAAIVRCVDADGAVSYQDQPCSFGEQSSEILLPDEPAYAPPEPEPEPPEAAIEGYDLRPPLPDPLPEPRSWRCTAENEEVFYRHDDCPETIAIIVDDMSGYAGAGHVYVDAMPIRRSEACASITAGGGRFGSDRDQRAAPYEKLTGKDLCR